jgi:hypothetical protein
MKLPICSTVRHESNIHFFLTLSKYMSQAIPRRVYDAQKALMKELGVPFLDLFEAYYLSGPWTREGDARHYQDSISALLTSYYWKGLNRTEAFMPRH